MKRLTGIRSILVLAFTLSLLIPLIVMLLYAHFITAQALATQALERHSHEVTLQAQHIEQSLAHIRDDAAYLLRLRSIRQVQTGTGTINDVEQDFTVFAIANPMIQRLLYTGDGITIGIDNSSVTPRLIDADVLTNADYQSFLGQYAALETGQIVVSFDLVWDMPVVRYALPHDDGVLVIEVLASWVLRNMPGVEANSIWAIINRNGQHLLFPLPDEYYDNAIPATDDALSPYLSDFQSTESGTIAAGRNSFIYSRIYPTNDHQHYWLLYQQVPRSELYAVVNDFYRSGAIILIVAVIAALMISGFIAGQIIRPLTALQRKVRDFAAGQTFDTSAKPLQLTELNDLHQSFYSMATQLDSERQQKRQLIKQLISAQEDERKRIAYDLHDGLIQQLVVAKMYTSMLKNDAPESQLENVEHSEEALTHAIVEGRRIIDGLHPTILDDLGLVDAIAELANQQAKRYGWTLDLDLDNLPEEPDMTVSITIFRIVQEALNNVGKHANAKTVSISLNNGDSVKLCITDDGKGFDTSRGKWNGGIGIGTMRERAVTLSGTCKIESAVGQGTTVTINLPYE